MLTLEEGAEGPQPHFGHQAQRVGQLEQQRFIAVLVLRLETGFEGCSAQRVGQLKEQRLIAVLVLHMSTERGACCAYGLPCGVAARGWGS